MKGADQETKNTIGYKAVVLIIEIMSFLHALYFKVTSWFKSKLKEGL